MVAFGVANLFKVVVKRLNRVGARADQGLGLGLGLGLELGLGLG